MIAPLLPEIERRTGATEGELGLALAAYALPILVVSLPFGRLADRIGRRPLLLGGLLMTVAGSLLIAASEALAPLVAGRAVQGIGSAASWIAALALVSDFAPPGRKGQAIGFALAANSVGAIGGPAIGGLGRDAVSYEFPFLLVAALALLLAAAGRAVLPRDGTARRQTPAMDLGALLRLVGSRRLLPATVGVVAGAGVLGLVEVVAPLDADQRLGLSASAIGALFAATIALDAAAAPVAGGAGDRIGRTPVAVLGLGLLALSVGLLAVLGGVAGLVVGLCVFGVGSSTLFAAAVPWLDEAFGELDRGFGYGLLNIVYALGYSAGPLAAGFAFAAGGADLAYALAAAAIAVPVGLLLLGRPPQPMPGHRPG